MKTTREPPLLRMHRRTYGFTLREIAEILGMRSTAHLSRIEHGKRRPTLETALVTSALFGVPLAELFPQLMTEMESRVRARLTAVRKGCDQTSTPTALRKRALLDELLSEDGTESIIDA